MSFLFHLMPLARTLLCLRRHWDVFHTGMFLVPLIFYHGNLMLLLFLIKTYTLSPAYMAREEEESSSCWSLSWNRTIFQILYYSISTETVAWGLQRKTLWVDPCAFTLVKELSCISPMSATQSCNCKIPQVKLNFALSISRNFTNLSGRNRKIMNLEKKLSSASR